MSFLTVAIVIISISYIILSNWRARRPSKLPPGPFGYPIIGNIPSLGSSPHRSLAELSKKYGPIMSLKLGSRTTIVMSSPEAAKQVFQKHDLALSSRTVPSAATSLNHGASSLGWLPIGNEWRKLRKICKEQMFSVPRLEASQSLRKEKLQKVVDYVGECCDEGRTVDVGEVVFATMLNLISVSLFSMEFVQFGSDSSQEMKDVAAGVMKCLGSPNVADFFPILQKVDPQGVVKETSFYFGKLFAIFDGVIEDRLKSGAVKNDLLQALIDINRANQDELTKEDIKHLLLDLFIGGTDTSAGTVEWAMAELVRHPDKMARLRNEIRSFIKEKGELQEADIPQLPYLLAVVKETFRLHPVAPLLVPHKATTQVEIENYVVPKDAQILINVWAMGRDPSIWPNPEEFVPERFLNEYHNIDFRGQDFELVPFGSGRRICPGLPLAYRSVHQMLATFVGNFDWKPETAKGVDMTERFGLTLTMANSLKAVPTKLY